VKLTLKGDSESFYRRRPSLRKPESNVRLLLTWSFMPHGHTFEALRHWVGSEEGLSLYQRLIDDLRFQQTLQDVALTLGALLSWERLLVHSEDHTTDPLECGSVCLDAVLNGEGMSNKRASYEQVIILLMHMLHSLEDDNDDLIQLLTNVLGDGAPLLGPLDGIAGQYCPGKVSELDHSKAFKDAWKGLVKSMVATESADREWIVVSRSSPGSVLGSNRLSLDV